VRGSRNLVKWASALVAMMITLCFGTVISPFVMTAQAFPGSLQLPTPPGETWYICQGYASTYRNATHAAPSFALDITAGSPCNLTASTRKPVYSPASGTIVRYETPTGSLCVNMDGGGSVDVTHIVGTPTSGRLSKGQQIGSVAPAGTLGNNGMAHIHLEVSSQPNCQWVGGRYLSGSTPFDSAHGTRLECAPELPAGGPVGLTGQGQWSRTALANTCQGINNGDFVVVRETGAVFRVAGGAPIYVSTWSAFGGAQPTKSISQAQLDAMATVPANGTFVVGAQRGEVYRIAGGAPLYVSNWAVFGGPQPTVTVDQAAIDNAGAGSLWNHLRTYPADGTFVSTSPRGEVYRIAGGAPLYVSNWAVFGGAQPTTTVDAGDIDNAGAGSVWNHLRTYPADGTFVLGVQSNKIYKVMRSAARYVPTWDVYGGQQPYTPVDQGDIDNAGAGRVWNHLVPAPSTLGDLNSDGYVGCADQAVLQAHFGETPAGPGHGDLNSDGTINVIDLSILLSHWAPPPGDSC